MKKRILSFLLMLVMVVSMVPVMATATAAAEGEKEITADDLYVTEGLVAWWDAFDAANNDTVDIANGKWYSRVGDATASLMGGKWGVQKGGLGYALTKSEWDADTQKGSYYLDMGIENLPETSYTVDMVATFTGLTNADGTRYVDGAHKWGVYNDKFAALELENWKFTAFVCMSSTTTAGSGQCAIRPSYHNGYWNADNGRYWISEGQSFYFRDAKHADTPASLVIRSTVDTYSRTGTSRWDAEGNHYSMNRVVTTKGSSLKVNFDLGAQADTNTVKVEISSGYKRPFVDEADGKTYYETYYAPSECFLARDTNDKFLLMRDLPGTVYAVRVYDRELTPAEMNRNHFADLVKYIGADLSAFKLMDEETMNTVYTLTSALDFTISKEALQSKIDEVGDLVKMIDEATTVYDKLYVQDGLVMLLDAFGKDNTSVEISTGTWYNLVNLAVPAFLKSGSGTAWKFRADNGVGYDLTNDQHKAGNQGCSSYLDIGNAPVNFSGNFTVEYAANVMILSNDGVVADNAASAGYTTGCVNERYGAWGIWLYQGNNFRIIYNNTGKDGHYGHGAGCYGWNGPDMFLSNGGAVTYSNVITFNPEVSTRTYYANGAVKQAWTTGVKDVQSNEVKPIANVQLLYILRSMANTLYNVRVYDRALSVEEIKWNGFIDLCAYFGLDVSAIVDVKDLVMNLLPSACSFLNFASSEADIARAQATINEAAAIAANVVAAQESATEYDALYVQDGMTVLLSAYDAADAVSVDLAHGLWINKVDTTYATLLDGGNAEKYGWKVGENGGIYYRIPTANEFVSVSTKTGMTLPADAISDGDFTVEFVFDPLGLSGDDNVIDPHTGEAPQSQWGAYNGSRSAFAFGGFQMCMFHYSKAGSGNTMRSRVFYYNKAWEAGANSNKVSFVDHPTIFADKVGGEWKEGMMTMTLDRTVTDGADYKIAEFSGSVAGATFTFNNGTGVKDGKAEHQFFTQEMNPAVEAFIGFPAQVYAVRVYNRVLTAAEKAQNHFADVAAYLGLNTFGVEFLEGAKAAAFYDLFADADFTSDKDVLQNKIFGALAALDVLMGAGETEATVTEDDLVITATYGAASMPLGSLAMLGFTVEMGVVLAPITSEDMTAADITVVRGENAFTPSLETSLVLVNYSSEEESAYVTGENFFAPMGVMFQMDLSYKDVVVANGLEAMVKAPLVFRGFIAITDAEGNTSIIYNDDVTSKSFYEFADYYVNDFEGDKYLMHEYNTNETLVGIIGAENVEREIGLGVDADDQTQTTDKDAALGDIPETGITGAEDIKQDGEDDVASTQVDKIRPTADSNASYSFVSTVDGKVRLVIEYVAKAYTLGDRAITIKVDGYQTMTVVLSDSVTGINTDRNNHGFYVVEFEVAAGTHNIVIGAAEGARAVEIFSIAVDAQ